MNRILTVLKKNNETVGAKLRQLLAKRDPDYPELFESMGYSLDGGGKRIRPALVLEFCRALGGDTETALTFASALEMIHTYSLIHDDLPCMDNDDYRRGRLTNHKVFGENIAVLAGDALLTMAFETVSGDEKIPPEKAIKAVRILSDAAGAFGMIGGQCLDLKGEKEILSEETHRKMNLLKTGALIKAAAGLGVLASEADESQYKAAEVYAENVGLAFQVEDDLLDRAEKGKEEEKTTFLSFMTEKEAEEYIEKLTENACEAVKKIDGEGILSEFARFLAKRSV